MVRGSKRETTRNSELCRGDLRNRIPRIGRNGRSCDWIRRSEIETVISLAELLRVRRVVVESNSKIQCQVSPDAPVILRKERIVVRNECSATVQIVLARCRQTEQKRGKVLAE